MTDALVITINYKHYYGEVYSKDLSQTGSELVNNQ
jgi:hypothetical protein